LKNKIGFKTSGFSEKKYPRIQFGNVMLYNWLIEIGLMPQKTKIMGAIKVPDKYFFDFLRGYFDGDGSCHSYWDKRWKNSFMFYTKFSSASKKNILWLEERIKKLINIKGSLDHLKKSNVYQLKYAKTSSRTLFSKMYYKKDLPCLERKYIKFKKILNT